MYFQHETYIWKIFGYEKRIRIYLQNWRTSSYDDEKERHDSKSVQSNRNFRAKTIVIMFSKWVQINWTF